MPDCAGTRPTHYLIPIFPVEASRLISRIISANSSVSASSTSIAGAISWLKTGAIPSILNWTGFSVLIHPSPSGLTNSPIDGDYYEKSNKEFFAGTRIFPVAASMGGRPKENSCRLHASDYQGINGWSRRRQSRCNCACKRRSGSSLRQSHPRSDEKDEGSRFVHWERFLTGTLGRWSSEWIGQFENLSRNARPDRCRERRFSAGDPFRSFQGTGRHPSTGQSPCLAGSTAR